ncbi:hypothetical protein CHH28_09715 [Bacterioplanes sanyensis]|uniref:Zinc finger/thioredoxin putative domain-containing protein n=1 Tax=Bacterioplanes sanyensis TaxID=1249553 RepID=A0A222FJJ5_9GAMM|nr:DUF3426 domain-containing protein [Bacterioplanes sanyensis]ASP38940.1 hypothetical protein CHH28_09715 [Bacterioplanes sanyensis]
MATHVTRCPHCHTTFRVRAEHLKVANGAVRCGSCLQVFKATDYFVDEEKPAVAAKPETSDDDIGMIFDDMDSQTAVDDDDDDFGLIHDDMDLDDSDDVPDQIADDPLADLGLRPEERKDAKPVERSALIVDDAFLEFELPVDEDKKAQKEEESWTDELLREDEEITLEDLDRGDEFSRPVFSDAGDPDDIIEAETGRNSDRQDGMTLGRNELPTETLELVPPADELRIAAEPLQFAQPRQRRALPWGWALGALAMLALVLAQTAYFRFDDWSRQPQWRPWYAKACEVLQCSLPAIQNMNKIATQHLVVRAHPDLQGALVVDTLINNLADYPQPFPDLALIFRDLNENLVASRSFSPQEYLSGELAGRNDMPVRTPIHISLEIVDPGPKAVSYAIQLMPNQTP